MDATCANLRSAHCGTSEPLHEDDEDARQLLYPPTAGQPIMLPLTSSVYVNGTLASKESVLVDIGTGYYIEVCYACLQDLGGLGI